MRWLVTGGAGFIGSHLIERLLEGGHEVVAVDDLSTGSRENLDGVMKHSRFRFVNGNVADKDLVDLWVGRADIVVHLAAVVGVRRVVESPARTIAVNVNATENVLRAAAARKKRILVTSTSEVYGKRTQMPFRETDDLVIGSPTRGRWSYAATKMLDEFLALAYLKEYGLPATIVRLFNTVGPRQTGRYGMVLPTFARQALRGQPITVFGDGTQMRCFGHVRDVVAGIERLCLTESTVGEIYNLGGGAFGETTIRQLAELVRDVAQSKSPITVTPYEEAYEAGFEDMHRRVPDVSKAARAVGYQPTKTLREIVTDVVAYERGVA